MEKQLGAEQQLEQALKEEKARLGIKGKLERIKLKASATLERVGKDKKVDKGPGEACESVELGHIIDNNLHRKLSNDSAVELSLGEEEEADKNGQSRGTDSSCPSRSRETAVENGDGSSVSPRENDDSSEKQAGQCRETGDRTDEPRENADGCGKSRENADLASEDIGSSSNNRKESSSKSSSDSGLEDIRDDDDEPRAAAAAGEIDTKVEKDNDLASGIEQPLALLDMGRGEVAGEEEKAEGCVKVGGRVSSLSKGARTRKGQGIRRNLRCGGVWRRILPPPAWLYKCRMLDNLFLLNVESFCVCVEYAYSKLPT